MAFLTNDEILDIVLLYMQTDEFESESLEEAFRQDLMADPERFNQYITAQNDPNLSLTLEALKKHFGLPSYSLDQTIEGALLSMENGIPADVDIAAINQALKDAGLPHGDSDKWTTETSLGIENWMFDRGDNATDPAIRDRIQEFLNHNIGSGGSDGATRGAPRQDPTIQDVEDCGASILGGAAIQTHNCAREL